MTLNRKELIDLLNEYLKLFLDRDVTPEDFIKEKISIVTHEKITEEWFEKTFLEITQEFLNGETACDVEFFQEGEKFLIRFSIDCGDYGVHRGNQIEIYDDRIIVDVSETPVEGCGIIKEHTNC